MKAFVGSAVAGMVTCLLVCAGAAAAETPAAKPGAAAAETPAAKPGAAWPKGRYAQLDQLPDWGGVWVLGRPRPVPGSGPPEQPKLKGEYLEHYHTWQKETKEHNGMAPRDTSNCMPPGMPAMMGSAQYPIEFLFTPGRVTTLHEAWMQTRTIFTDGRSHPDDLEPGIFGHSIGHWEGDVLVVDTIGIKTVTELAGGMKHGADLHIIERIHLAKGDADTLLDEMTMEDPEALEVPYHRTLSYQRQRDWNLMEFVCAENDRNPVGTDGMTGFK